MSFKYINPGIIEGLFVDQASNNDAPARDYQYPTDGPEDSHSRTGFGFDPGYGGQYIAVINAPLPTTDLWLKFDLYIPALADFGEGNYIQLWLGYGKDNSSYDYSRSGTGVYFFISPPETQEQTGYIYAEGTNEGWVINPETGEETEEYIEPTEVTFHVTSRTDEIDLYTQSLYKSLRYAYSYSDDYGEAFPGQSYQYTYYSSDEKEGERSNPFFKFGEVNTIVAHWHAGETGVGFGELWLNGEKVIEHKNLARKVDFTRKALPSSSPIVTNCLKVFAEGTYESWTGEIVSNISFSDSEISQLEMIAPLTITANTTLVADNETNLYTITADSEDNTIPETFSYELTLQGSQAEEDSTKIATGVLITIPQFKKSGKGLATAILEKLTSVENTEWTEIMRQTLTLSGSKSLTDMYMPLANTKLADLTGKYRVRFIGRPPQQEEGGES